MNSKKKGNRFELEVAKLLSDVTKKQWYRVGVSSGARHTTQGLSKGFTGDVFIEDKEFDDVIIECKATNGLLPNDFFSKKGKIFEYIEQCNKEASEKAWVLFIKPNNKGVYCVFRNQFLNARFQFDDKGSIFLMYGRDEYLMMKIK